MKTINNFFTISCLGALTLFTSCEKEGTTTNEEIETNEVSQEILTKIEALAFNTEGVTLEDFMLPDGTTEKRYIVEDHIALTPDYINTMELNGGVQSEQYRTNNLVSAGTISIIGYTGGSNALSTANRNGLQMAVDNYNALNLSIPMTLTFGTANYQNYDIVVYKDPESEADGDVGGSAGFPSGGNPEQYIQTYGLDNLSNDINEHVIAHEIGHAIGFRHTDYFSRQSCGQNSNEGTAGVGNVHIPGTPTGYDSSSLMLACFANNVDGEFGQYDIVALNYLY